MKNTMKLFLTIALFCTTAFADGNMGGGGFTDGNMGGGGKTCTGNCLVDSRPTAETGDSDNSVMKFIEDYLISIFG